MECAGEKNAYYCEACRGYIVVILCNDGVTPMFLACRVKGEPNDPGNDCKGRMHSLMYPAEPWPERDGYGTVIPKEPTHEWYAPDGRELRKLRRNAPEMHQHCIRGGLLLRRLDA